jgi:hypothetical protein
LKSRSVTITRPNGKRKHAGLDEKIFDRVSSETENAKSDRAVDRTADMVAKAQNVVGRKVKIPLVLLLLEHSALHLQLPLTLALSGITALPPVVTFCPLRPRISCSRSAILFPLLINSIPSIPESSPLGYQIPSARLPKSVQFRNRGHRIGESRGWNLATSDVRVIKTIP